MTPDWYRTHCSEAFMLPRNGGLVPIPDEAVIERSKLPGHDNFYLPPKIVQCFIERGNKELPADFCLRAWTINRCVTLFHGGTHLAYITYEAIEDDIVLMLDRLPSLTKPAAKTEATKEDKNMSNPMLQRLVEQHKDKFETVTLYGTKLSEVEPDELRAWIAAQGEKEQRRFEEQSRRDEILPGGTMQRKGQTHDCSGIIFHHDDMLFLVGWKAFHDVSPGTTDNKIIAYYADHNGNLLPVYRMSVYGQIITCEMNRLYPKAGG